jgi:hypothetical protein
VHHDDGPLVVLDHVGKEQPVELRAAGLIQLAYLVRRLVRTSDPG